MGNLHTFIAQLKSLPRIEEVCKLFNVWSLGLPWNVGIFIKGDLRKEDSNIVLLDKCFLSLEFLNHEIPIKELRKTIFNEIVIGHDHITS